MLKSNSKQVKPGIPSKGGLSKGSDKDNDIMDQLIAVQDCVNITLQDSWYYKDMTDSNDQINAPETIDNLGIQYSHKDISKWDSVQLCKWVMSQGYPNAWCAQIPVCTDWNLDQFESLLCNYYDKEAIQWLKYGWLISRPPNIADPIPTYENHASANNYPQFIEQYIDKEMERGGICGPFDRVPFDSRVGVSPLST